MKLSKFILFALVVANLIVGAFSVHTYILSTRYVRQAELKVAEAHALKATNEQLNTAVQEALRISKTIMAENDFNRDVAIAVVETGPLGSKNDQALRYEDGSGHVVTYYVVLGVIFLDRFRDHVSVEQVEAVEGTQLTLKFDEVIVTSFLRRKVKLVPQPFT